MSSIFKNILNLFTPVSSLKSQKISPSIAFAALMIRLARSDDNYAKVEITLITQILQDDFDLTYDQALSIRQEAEKIEANASDIVRFTRVVKANIPYEKRIVLIERLWSLVLVDGNRDNKENLFLRLVSKLLGVNDRDSALARQRMQKK